MYKSNLHVESQQCYKLITKQLQTRQVFLFFNIDLAAKMCNKEENHQFIQNKYK